MTSTTPTLYKCNKKHAKRSVIFCMRSW
jgi:hypothetical protein